MGQKQKKIRQKEQQDYRQNNKMKCRKMGSNCCSEIPDRGETSEIPGLHSQDTAGRKQTVTQTK